MLRAAVIGITMILFAGCTSSPGDDAVEDEPSLILFVSNQSFDDDRIRMTVTLDGEQVVDDQFEVRNQHTWVEYRLAPPPGTHELVATSSTGTKITSTVDIPAVGPLYAVVEYWYYADDLDREITFRVQDEPFQFD